MIGGNIYIMNLMTKNALCQEEIGFGKGQDFFGICQHPHVKSTCIKVLSHIGRILSRVAYVTFIFSLKNQTEGLYR